MYNPIIKLKGVILLGSYEDINISKALYSKYVSSMALQEPSQYKGRLKQFQQKGVVYAYFAKRCGIFDVCGSGKSHHIMALMSLLKDRCELGRCIYVVPAADILAKRDELIEFTSLNFGMAVGKKLNRVSLYGSLDSIDFLLVSYEVLRRDSEYLLNSGFSTVFLDEAHIFKNPDTLTAKTVLGICEGACRVVTLTATPVQMSLLDLHTQIRAWHNGILTEHVGAFKRRYCTMGDVFRRSGKKVVKERKIVSYKNMIEFKKCIDPFYIRRSLSEIESELPSLIVEKVWGSLTGKQLSLYNELQNGVVELLQSGNKVEAKKHIHSMQKLVNSTSAAGDDSDYSWKFDWILYQLFPNLLGSGFSNEKIIVFGQHKNTLRVLSKRLHFYNISHVIIFGDNNTKENNKNREIFCNDSSVKVLLGTSSIECSLNLQVARYLVCVDIFSNPARVEQLVGRIRRLGSEHSTKVFLMLLTKSTFEEKLIERLEKRQAVHNFIFNECSDIIDSLPENELLQLFK